MSHPIRTLAAALLGAASLAAVAAPVTSQGTWWGTDGTLRARDIDGNAVALNDASAAFFYDVTTNVTWLANFNAGAGSSYDDGFSNDDGRMTWSNATAWAAALNVGDYTGWRLPKIIDNSSCVDSFAGGTECGQNVLTQVGTAYSEWAHLYYVTLGNLASCAPGGSPSIICIPQAGYGPEQHGLLHGVQSHDLSYYWTGTEYALDTRAVWFFLTSVSYQYLGVKDKEQYAVAVRPGDVLRGGNVPEPQGWALALTALGAPAWVRRRRQLEASALRMI